MENNGFPLFKQGLSKSGIIIGLPCDGAGKLAQILSSVHKCFPSEYQVIWYVTFFHERIESFTGTSHLRATSAEPGSSGSCLIVGSPRKSLLNSAGASIINNRIKFLR